MKPNGLYQAKTETRCFVETLCILELNVLTACQDESESVGDGWRKINSPTGNRCEVDVGQEGAAREAWFYAT